MAAKGPARLAQDVVHTSSGFAAVFDGVTSVRSCACCGARSGRLAAQACAEGLQELRGDEPFGEVLRRLTEQLRRHTEELSCRGRAWATTASIYSAAAREVWLVGDAQALVDGRVHRTTKEVDRIAAAFRSAVVTAALLSGEQVTAIQSEDPGREAILPLLRAQKAFQNNPAAGELAFAVLSPQTVPERLCLRVRVEGGAGTEVVLATDGYPELRDTLPSSEEALRQLLRTDPLLVGRHKETKGLMRNHASFDDRAYVRLRLDGDVTVLGEAT